MEEFQDPLIGEEEIPIRDRAAHRAGVSSVIGQSFPIVGDALSPTGFKSYELSYQKDGRRIRQETFDQDGRLVRRWNYDRRGRPVGEVTYGRSGQVEYRFEVAYDDAGWTEKRMYSSPGTVHYRVVAERGAGGRLLRARYEGPAHEALRTDSYQYGANGLLRRVDMGPLGESTYEYDERGNLTLKRTDMPGASADGEVYVFVYDARDLLTRMTRRHFVAITFEYTAAGSRVEPES